MSDIASNRREVRARLIRENEFPPIPKTWSVERLRFLFTESKERNGKFPIGEMLSVSEYKGVVPREYDNEEQMRTTEELANYRVVRPGQLAVNSMWLNHLGLGVSEHTGHVSPAYNVYDISERLDRRFVHHLMRSNYYLKIYMRYLYGIRPNSFQIKSSDWASIPIIAPDLPRQRQIADFLDRETARIDLLIEKKQRFLDILAAKMAVTIERLVCGGLGLPSLECQENVDESILRASGWVLTPVKRVARIRGGYAFSSDDFSDTGVQLVRISTLYENKLQLNRQPVFLPESYILKHSEFAVQNGDILMSLTGTLGKRDYGFSVLVDTDTPLLLNQRVARIRTNNRALNSFLLLALRTKFYLDQLYALPSGTKQANLSNDDVLNIKIPLPPISVQKRIVQEAHNFSSPLESLSEKTNTSIDRLKEYRSALITSAVTGQIDVTSYAKSGTP